MFQNYFKIALRNLLQHRAFSLINISGLAIGLTAGILIFLFLQHEMSYDRFHAHADRIYRVVNERHGEGKVFYRAATPPGYAATMKSEFPEVIEAVRFFDMGKILVEHDDRRFFEENFLLADSTVLKVFSFELLAGDPNTALTSPSTVVISKKMAQKYFGDADPVGQILRLQTRRDFKITGVMADLPENSHLKFDFLGSFSSLYNLESAERLRNFIWQQFTTYLLLPENYDSKKLEAKLPAYIAKYAEPQTSKFGFSYKPFLQPLTDVHLRSVQLDFDIAQKGDIHHVYAFAMVAAFILLIACFNFMNLSTARAANRAKEVGLRKVVGAQRGQLVHQFLSESILMTILSLAIALGLVELLLPAFNGLTGKTLTLNYARNWLAAFGLVSLSLAVGILAGSYPAFFLSRFQPVNVLKGSSFFSPRGTKAGLRRILVVTQFTISLALIVGTFIVLEQLHFLKNKKLGFEKEQIVVLPIRNDEMRRNCEGIKNELLTRPEIVSATVFYGTPGGMLAGDDIRFPGSPTHWSTYMILLDRDYLKTFGMEIIAGRGFSHEFSTDAD
ncbi:MAG TPA: ABC transporter permease, partial [bacterium]